MRSSRKDSTQSKKRQKQKEKLDARHSENKRARKQASMQQGRSEEGRRGGKGEGANTSCASSASWPDRISAMSNDHQSKNPIPNRRRGREAEAAKESKKKRKDERTR